MTTTIDNEILEHVLKHIIRLFVHGRLMLRPSIRMEVADLRPAARKLKECADKTFWQAVEEAEAELETAA